MAVVMCTSFLPITAIAEEINYAATATVTVAEGQGEYGTVTAEFIENTQDDKSLWLLTAAPAYNYRFSSWEGGGQTVTSAVYNVTLTVDTGYIAYFKENTAPMLKFDILPTTAEIMTGDAYELDLSSVFEDVDDDLLAYQVSINGADPIMAEKSYSYALSEAGEYILTFTASDGDATSESYTITLTVISGDNNYNIMGAETAEISLFTGGSSTTVEYANQTEDGNYTISNAEQLVTLAEKVNEGTSYSDSIFTLLNDINLSSVCGETEGNWTPIGNSQTTPFSGAFDGNSNVISGLYISGNLSNQSLFGYLNSAEIKNLTVDGELINSTKNALNIGGIAANAVNSNFINCTNKVDISSTAVAFKQIGGIVGNGTGLTFDNCMNEASITAPTSTIIGGIIGTGNDNITFNNCTNEGNIIAKDTIGGIIGSGKNLIFNDCVNEGNITASGTKVGGIAGDVT